MNAVNLFVSNWSGRGSFELFNVNLFDLIPLTACENMCWMSSGPFWEVGNTLLWCWVTPWEGWLLDNGDIMKIWCGVGGFMS